MLSKVGFRTNIAFPLKMEKISEFKTLRARAFTQVFLALPEKGQIDVHNLGVIEGRALKNAFERKKGAK